MGPGFESQRDHKSPASKRSRAFCLGEVPVRSAAGTNKELTIIALPNYENRELLICGKNDVTDDALRCFRLANPQINLLPTANDNASITLPTSSRSKILRR
jgi:hypothetical protein